MSDFEDRLAGVLLGTAVGDALGLPSEGMSARAVARRFPDFRRYRFLGSAGVVSDDTEQTALVAESLLGANGDPARFVARFRKELLRWFLRLPWGIGLGTLKACLRIAVGLQPSGANSAGNGAAMRAAIVGVFFHRDTERRRVWSDAVACVTHRDVRAIEGARYVAELAALAADHDSTADREALARAAAACVQEESVRDAIEAALTLPAETTIESAGATLGNSGFVLHTLALATYAFVRFGNDPAAAMAEVIRAGGDTDSTAAIVGAWVGALHGAARLPQNLVATLHDRRDGRRVSFAGPSHLRALATALASARSSPVYFSGFRACLRNLLLMPVVTVHAFRVAFSRLFP